MQTDFPPLLRTTSLLIAFGLFAGCSGNGTNDVDGADAAAKPNTSANVAQERQVVARAPVQFEGTIQQLVISLDADAISSIAGSRDLAIVMALPPERVIAAVLAGDVEAKSIQKSTLEIDGRMGRLQVEGDESYTILDGKQMAIRVVNPDDRMILRMDSATLAAAAGQEVQPMNLKLEKVGEREIRGFDATGYRFDFIGDNIATVWLSEELESEIGPIFDIWLNISPLGRMELGKGAPVRTVMVNPGALSGGSSFMPAYTVTDFHDLIPGVIADERFVLPAGYKQQSMTELGRGPG